MLSAHMLSHVFLPRLLTTCYHLDQAGVAPDGATYHATECSNDFCNFFFCDKNGVFANPGELIGGSIFSAIGKPQVPRQLSTPAPHPARRQEHCEHGHGQGQRK